MATATNIPGTRPNIGGAIGTGLGEGLNLLLGQMIQKKVRQRKQAATASGLTSLGVPQDISTKVSQMPEHLQLPVIIDYLKNQGMGQGSGELGEALKEFQGMDQGQMQAQPEQVGGIQQLLGGIQQQASQQEPQGLEGIGQQLSPVLDPASLGLQEQQQEPQVAPPVRQAEVPKRRPFKPGLTKREKAINKFLSSKTASKADKIKLIKLMQSKKKTSLAERKFAHKKQSEINKDTKKAYTDILSQYKDSREADMRLNRMAELNKRKLTGPIAKGFMDTLAKGIGGYGGLDISGLQNVDSQEFDKISKDFLKFAKTIFGSRVTEGEIVLFLKTIPSLNQSKGGRSRVIRNLKLLNEGSKVRKEAMDELIASNDGKRPANLESLVEEQAKPKLDEIAKRFKKEVKKEEKPESFLRKFQDLKPEDLISIPLAKLRDLILSK